jgi:DUF4097 and DUF4098 domain-containing protein YvlB
VQLDENNVPARLMVETKFDLRGFRTVRGDIQIRIAARPIDHRLLNGIEYRNTDACLDAYSQDARIYPDE